jgi:hypothetical protein
VNEPLDEQKRMLDAITVSSGAVDTIVAYPLAGTEIDWLDGPGHRRPNVYHPAQAWETDVQTAIRLYRQQAESIVNTIAPANSRNPSREVAAWMGMPRSILNGDGEDAFYPYISRKTARNLLAMFRGKNIKESMYYTDSGGIPLTEFEDAWNQMQRTVVEVYSTRVRKYTRTFAQGFASSYEDAGETQQQKASRLEFTLRDNAQNPPVDREVRLNSKLIPVTYPTPSTVHQTVLTVDLDWIDTTYMEDMTQYEINIECSIEFTGENAQRVRDASDFGEVQLWHSDGNGSGFYDTVNDNWPGVYAPTYTFNAPKSLGDNRYRMRIQFLTTYVDGSVFADASTGNIPTTRLRLRHQSPFAFISRYDLVQVIPTHEVSNPLGGQAFAANSDMNHDGVVDPTDLSIYLDEWMMDSPAADFDSDESVTGEDVDAFVEAYVNGT